ncbi:MAG: ferrochelatase [Melioribacteraceae bacterium]|nr:ferrochelatase [Melioribacteraceae bacterium]MCF8355892.1 ferrochelatase [Melioribacteraceae bacterium]MCF8395199.1 ferrochelatase [Melioribacteraceae bacterium]MCF8420673.1 ferrochelatase [Melioribacteraceae bacterium]
MNKYAVVLLNLGGPDSLDAIEPFLFNLFSDPDIFNIPIGQKFVAKVISRRRAPKVKKEYELIGGKSPINEWTELQRKMLEDKLNDAGQNVDVHVAMRYWKPLTKTIVEKVQEKNYEKIILLPLYPHYSITTTGSSFNEWNRHYSGDQSKLIYVNDYYLNDKYIDALNQRIDEGLMKFDESIREKVQLVFSAHGTPISLVKKGDPYSIHIKETVNKVMEKRKHSHEHHLCYQSKVGPVKWLEPATDDMIKELASQNKMNMLVIPISFVSDHVETLFELDIEYRHAADEVKIENYIVMEGLNDSQLFIDALKEIILEKVEKE